MKTLVSGRPMPTSAACPTTVGGRLTRSRKACLPSPGTIYGPRDRGEVPERSNGAVSKTVVRASVPRVRIPVSPPNTADYPLWRDSAADHHTPPSGAENAHYSPTHNDIMKVSHGSFRPHCCRSGCFRRRPKLAIRSAPHRGRAGPQADGQLLASEGR